MQDKILTELVSAFNRRDFIKAAAQANEGLLHAEGRDEVFWMGLGDACEGYAHLMNRRYDHAEQHFLAAMQNLRNFGFNYRGFEVTNLLAGLRRCAEEIRVVRSHGKRVYDVSLLPQLRLAEKAQVNY